MTLAPEGAAGDGKVSEEEVFSRLAQGDLPGAREATDRVVRATLERAPRLSEASHLLFELLAALCRQVTGHVGMPPPCPEWKIGVVRRLASASHPSELLSAFWSIWEEGTAPILAESRVGHPAVDQVRGFVQENFHRKISLSEIAGAVGISRNYLSHLFRKHCGLTVTEHIHRTRMKQAEQLLLAGDRTVSEIAYMTGYQNYRDFHRNFVKYQKTSPKRFRQARARSRRAAVAAT